MFICRLSRYDFDRNLFTGFYILCKLHFAHASLTYGFSQPPRPGHCDNRSPSSPHGSITRSRRPLWMGGGRRSWTGHGTTIRDHCRTPRDFCTDPRRARPGAFAMLASCRLCMIFGCPISGRAPPRGRSPGQVDGLMISPSGIGKGSVVQNRRVMCIRP